MCTFEKDLECLQSSYHPEVTTVNIIVHCISVPLTAFLYHVYKHLYLNKIWINPQYIIFCASGSIFWHINYNKTH